jgi:hypothetical protein
MKLLLEIEDEIKATHLLEVLKELPYVKTEQISVEKAELLRDIKAAVEELKLVKAGHQEAKDAEIFLDEL